MLFHKKVFSVFGIQTILVGLLVGLALATRIAASTQLAMDFYSDDAVYMSMARYFFEGDFAKILHPHWRPFYPFVSALFYPLTGDWAFTARLVSVVFGSLLVVPVYFLVNSFTNRLTAVFASLLIVFFQPLISSSTASLTEALFTFLVWAGLYAGWYSLTQKRALPMFFAGILGALAYLTRSEGIFLFASTLFSCLILTCFIVYREHLYKQISKNGSLRSLYLGGILVVSFVLTGVSLNFSLDGRFNWIGILLSKGIFLIPALLLFHILFALATVIYFKAFRKVLDKTLPLLLSTLLLVIGFGAVYLPYKHALNTQFGKSPVTRKIFNSYRIGTPFTLNRDQTSTWAQNVWSVETADPRSETMAEFRNDLKPRLFYDIFINDGTKRITMFFERYIFPYFGIPGLILFLTGLALVICTAKKRDRLFLLGSTLGITFLGISLLAPTVHDRYIYVLLPAPLIVIAAAVCGSLKRKIPLILPAAALLIALFFIIHAPFLNLPNLLFKSNLSPSFIRSEIAEVDIWLSENDPGKRIMGIHEGLAFYSRSTLIYTPMAKDLDELLGYAKKWNVSYIISNPTEMTEGNKFLYMEKQDYPGLKLVHIKHSTAIYKVLY